MDFTFCPVLDEIIRTQRTVGQSGRVFDKLGALSTSNNLHVLRALMLERRPARTLEVGLAFGGSALTMAATHRELGHPPARQHTAIDPYQADGWDNAAVAALDRAGLGPYLDLRPQPSSLALPVLAMENAAFDLIYVDGSHFFEDVFIDAFFCFRMLTDHGIVLFDDCSVDHVSKVLGFVTANWGNWTAEVDLSKYRADGGSLRYLAARQLGRIQLRAFQRTGTNVRDADAPLRQF